MHRPIVHLVRSLASLLLLLELTTACSVRPFHTNNPSNQSAGRTTLAPALKLGPGQRADNAHWPNYTKLHLDSLAQWQSSRGMGPRFRRVVAGAGSRKRAKGREVRECLEAHNARRRRHAVPDLVWDPKIAAYAAKRAEYIAERGIRAFKHPKNSCVGENLYAQGGPNWDCTRAIGAFYQEIKFYDFNRAHFEERTGHFTAMIWRATRRVGCGMARGEMWGRCGVYLACNYWPIPNVQDKFRENVPPPVEPEVTSPPPTLQPQPEPQPQPQDRALNDCLTKSGV